ncbi:hypothetical protein CYMTET_39206 [Cymbomonas tetramitiformis]|uniref:Uncharacterized protein n=1 Tax=Cymbomonas tetramitiformis TaxID=36881 RepID=A0AAE0CAJ8_9CHLO|nr:hypothetical protein CYMTET_39206 [Cymbomonas tetramitiformis]
MDGDDTNMSDIRESTSASAQYRKPPAPNLGQTSTTASSSQHRKPPLPRSTSTGVSTPGSISTVTAGSGIPPGSISTVTAGSGIPPGSIKQPQGRLLRFANEASKGSCSGKLSQGAATSSSSETLTRVGGVINSRSSVHRGPSSAQSGSTSALTTSGSLQHDLEIFNMYKQMRREEQRASADWSSPYRFVDDAVDEPFTFGSISAREVNPLEGMNFGLDGFSDWFRSMEEALQQRRSRTRGSSPRTGLG